MELTKQSLLVIPWYEMQKLVARADQHDHLHKYLSVEETALFAFKCRWGGTHARSDFDMDDPEVARIIEQLDAEFWLVLKIIEALGLAECRDTLVGDNSTLRGLSGGERKRVTLAEMLLTGAPIFALDEPSTGLDGKLKISIKGNSHTVHEFNVLTF